MAGYIGAKVGTVTANAADIKGDISATDTTPEITLKNTTETDADGSRGGKITFKGEQSGGEESTLANIQASHDGSSDDEKGDLIFRTNDGSDGASPTERMRIDSEGDVGIGAAPQYGRLHIADGNSDIAMDANGSGQLHIDGNGYGFGVALNADGAQIYTNSASRDIIFGVNETERMRITDGNVGIGTTAPLRQLHIENTSANSEIAFTAGTSGVSSILFGDGLTGSDVYRGYLQYNHSDEALLFGVGSAERMRLDNNENLLVGKSTSSFSADGLVLSGTGNSSFVKTSDTVIFCNRLGTDGAIQKFYKAGVEVGSVVVFSGSTSYSTSSDYRMKENVVNIDDGITRVKQLTPKRFNFIATPDFTVDGFLAHEAQTVVPEAVHGTKDEVEVWADGDELPDGVSVGDNKLDDDGNTIPKMQGIDQAKLVPLLTAALQEAIAKIETLETKVAALEAK